MAQDQTPSEDIADRGTIMDEDAPGASGPIPDAVGSYDIKGVIGAGAMGVVYLARQSSPERDVAIKVMKSGVVSRKAMRRFEFEAQTLGRLQHPAIAQVYEASTWDDGDGARPYFAMEYVQDAKELGDFVQDHQLDARSRLELFCAACEGVEYGHRRGVIHRDLKPGNILVDVEGHPKVIDFGVARSTDSDSVSATLATEAGQLIGTLQYMSPEQVEIDPADLDTRSDVYALGVILYQLLVDRLPYDLTGTSLTQAASRIRELQPRRLGEIKSHLKGDLETICLKALEKDREQRYQSVNDLVEDICRYLADEPIMARPPTRTEQIRRFVRKNKAASLATCVVALALIAATTISVVFAVEAGRQRDQASQQRVAAEHAKEEADSQRTLAEQKTAEVQKQAENMHVMVNFQAEQLSSIDVTEMGESLRQEMLQELQLEPTDAEDVDFTGASVRLLHTHIFKPTLKSINTRYVDQPLVQASLLQALSGSLKSLGLLAEAMGPLVRALEIRTEHLGREHKHTLISIRKMADLLWSSRNFDQVLIYEQELLHIRRRIQGNDHPKTLDEMEDLADTLEMLDRYEEAKQYRVEILQISRQKWGDEHRRTLNEMVRLGEVYLELDEYEKAFSHFRDALETRQRIWGDEDSDTLESLEAMGELLKDQKKYEEATPYFKHVMEVRRRTLGNEHLVTQLAMDDMASLLMKQAKFDEAFAFSRKILDAQRRTNGHQHPTTLHFLHNFAMRLDGSNTDEEGALELYTELLDGYRHIGGDDGPQAVKMLSEIADHLRDDLERPNEAEPYLIECLEAQRRTLGDDHPETLDTLKDMGSLREDLERPNEAEPYFIECLEAQRRTLGDDHPETLDTLKDMGSALYSQGKYDEASPYYTEYLERNRRLLGDEDPDTLSAINLMGRNLSGQGKYVQAEALYIECLDARRRTLGDDHPGTMTTIKNLAYLLEKQGKHDQAEPYYSERLETQRRRWGDDHPRTIDSIKRMSYILFKQKKYDEAEPYCAERLALSRRLLGNDDPDTLSAMNMMGIILRIQGKYDEAESHYIECINARRRTLGDDHPDTLTTISNLAKLLMKQERYGEAVPIQLEVLVGQRRALGETHASSISSLKRVVSLFEAWHETKPDAGHDATAAKYQAQLDAIRAKQANEPTLADP